MKLLILHLSDIHLKTIDDPIVERATRIIDAVRTLQYDLDLCVVAVSGDIAYSGTDEQYILATLLLEQIRNGLSAELRPTVPVEFVLIPGNHDCDFTSSGDARQILIDKVTADSAPVGPEVAQLCTAAQQQFFTFRDSLAKSGLERTDPLYWEQRFECGGERLLFRCCNTAWASQKHEQHGQMYFPIERLCDQRGNATFAITMLHHPYNWLTPNNGRALRKRVEELSDLILTGHEHDVTLRT